MTGDVLPSTAPPKLRRGGPVDSDEQRQTIDLIRSLALSEARLHEMVFDRLGSIERAQTELHDVVESIQVPVPADRIDPPEGAEALSTDVVRAGMSAIPCEEALSDPPRDAEGPEVAAMSPPAVWVPAPWVPPAPSRDVPPEAPSTWMPDTGPAPGGERAAMPPPVWAPTPVAPTVAPREAAPVTLQPWIGSPATEIEAPAPAVPAAAMAAATAAVQVADDVRPDSAPVSPARWRMGHVLRVLQVVAICIAAVAAVVLAAVVIGPRFLPYRALIVRSGSMSPTIPTGSVAFYRQEQATQVRVGQVILFSEPGDSSIWITHRVVRIGDGPEGTYFITKGDANAVPDPWRVPAEGTGWIVVYHLPYVGYALSALSDGSARWVLIALPAFSLAFLLLLQVLRSKRGPPATQGA